MRPLLVVLTAGCFACQSSATEPRTKPDVTSPSRAIVSIDIEPDSIVLKPGARQLFSAVSVMSDGSRLPVQARWRVREPGVAVVDAYGNAIGIGVGRVEIRAMVDAIDGTAVVTVLPPDSVGESSDLLVDAFWVEELEYPSLPGKAFYAPQLRARAAPGRVVTVLTLEFLVPGLPYPTPYDCAALLGSKAPIYLNGEVYGDWAFTFDSDGHRATREPASVRVTFTDEHGLMASRTVHGPVVSGGLPESYGGDPGACFKGYRGPG